jgi:hypothetical protein
VAWATPCLKSFPTPAAGDEVRLARRFFMWCRLRDAVDVTKFPLTPPSGIVAITFDVQNVNAKMVFIGLQIDSWRWTSSTVGMMRRNGYDCRQRSSIGADWLWGSIGSPDERSIVPARPSVVFGTDWDFYGGEYWLSKPERILKIRGDLFEPKFYGGVAALFIRFQASRTFHL